MKIDYSKMGDAKSSCKVYKILKISLLILKFDIQGIKCMGDSRIVRVTFTNVTCKIFHS